MLAAMMSSVQSLWHERCNVGIYSLYVLLILPLRCFSFDFI